MHVGMGPGGPATAGYAPGADTGLPWVLKDVGELIQSGGLARLRCCSFWVRGYYEEPAQRALLDSLHESVLEPRSAPSSDEGERSAEGEADSAEAEGPLGVGR